MDETTVVDLSNSPEMIASAVYGRLKWGEVLEIANTGFVPDHVHHDIEDTARTAGYIPPYPLDLSVVGESLIDLCRAVVAVCLHPAQG